MPTTQPPTDLEQLQALQENQYPSLQALTVASLSHLSCAAYALLHIEETQNGQAIRDWLAGLADRLTFVAPKSAARARKNEPARNIAFTREGLHALGLTEDEISSFSFPFWEGMNSSRRSTILGDQGPTSPEKWVWGGPDSPPVHVLLMLFGSGPEQLDEILKEETMAWTAAHLKLCAPVLHAGQRKSTREHFGFLDGVGQPTVKGTPNLGNQKERTGHETVINAGEFVLGYTNQDMVASPSPMVAAQRDTCNHLPLGRQLEGGQWIEDATHRDLGFNGSYLVFRHLEQHVSHFWQTMLHAAGGDKAKAIHVAAKVIGRWPSGTPLTLYPDATSDPFPDGYPVPAKGQVQVENDFAYRESDAHGLGCPMGAHIRRANPRDSLGLSGEAALISARRHRLLRRGRVYGPDVADPFAPEEEMERGLFFICLCADIERQFEFVQQTWLNNPNFSGLNGESDPLLGQSSGGADAFTIPELPVRQRVFGLADFVTLRGGAYFFLPSIPAVRFLASFME